MQAEQRAKAELLKELSALRKRVSKLEQAAQKHRESEDKWRSLVDNAPDIIVVVDRDGTILHINHTVSGIAPEKVVGRSVYDYVPTEQNDTLRKSLERAFQTGQTDSFELVRPGPNETTSWYEGRVGPIKSGGEVVAAAVIAKDITDRKKAERLLRESEEKLRLFMDSATEGFTLWDSEFNLVKANRTVWSMFPPGTKQEDIIGKNALEIVPDIRQSGRYDQYMEVIKTGKPLFFEDLIPHPRFGNRHMDVKAFRVGNGLGVIAADITERKKAEELLRESETKWRSLAENAPNFIIIVDPEGTISFINHTESGCSVEEVVGKRTYDFLEPDYHNVAREAIKQVFATGQRSEYEARVTVSGGRTRWYETHVGPIKRNGKVTAATLISTDITERKKTEDALRASEETARAFFDVIPDTAVLMDTKFTILAMNKAGAERLGKSVDEIVGKNAADLMPADVFQLRRSMADEVIRTGKIIRYEDERAGLYFDTCICPVLDAQGTVERLAAFARDLTFRKRLEKETVELAKFPDENPDPILRISEDCKVLYANAASSGVLETWGIQVGQSLPEAYCNRAREALSSDKVSTFELNCNDGRIFLVTLAPVASQRYLNAYGVDITTRKKTEEALRESELRYRTLFESVPVGIGLATMDGRPLDCNNTMLRMTGYSKAEIRENNLKDTYVNPKQRAHVLKKLRTEGFVADFEAQLKRKDGTTYWANLTITPFPLLGERTLLTVALDTTERKQADEALRKEKGKAQNYLDIAGVMLLVVDADETVTLINRRGCDILGYSEDEVIGRNWFDTFIAEPIREQVRTAFSKLMAGDLEAVEYFENPVMTNSGEQRLIAWHNTVLKDEQGNIVGTLSSGEDITERKKAEEELHEAQAQYRALVEQIPAMTYIAMLDEASTTTYISPQVEQMLGIPPDDYKEEPDFWRRQLHPEDRQRVLARVAECHETRQPFICEYRMITKDGRTIWVSDHARIVQDRGGNPLCLQGVMLDVTKRRRAELALAAREEKYRTLYESSKDGIASSNMQGNFTGANQAYLDMLGYTLEELTKLTYQQVTPTKWHKPEKDIIRNQVLSRGYSDEYEKEYVKKDGTVLPVSMRAWLIKDERGEPAGTWAIVRDITERKKAEEALRESEEKFRTFVESASDLMHIADKDLNITDVNESMVRTLGYSKQEMIGMCATEIMSAENFERDFKSNWERYLTDGEIAIETNFVTKDGREIPGELKVVASYDNNGEYAGGRAVFRDMTERRRQEQALRESEENFKAVFDNASDGILVADPETTQYITGNRMICQMLGYTLEEIKNLEVKDIHPRDSLSDDLRKFEKVLNREITLSEDVPIRRKDGSVFHADINTGFLRFGGKECLMGIFRDITEHKQAQDRLDRYREKMAQAEQLASLGTLSATLAHELTQPLTVVRLSIENSLADLETTSCPASVTEGLQDSLAEVSHTVSIIDRLRNFARKSSKEQVSDVDLKAVAGRVTQLLDGHSRRAGITVRLENMDNLPSIFTNEKDMEQLFFALIENAVYAAKGKKECQLNISATVEGQHVELRFSDDCGGIAPEHLDKIFEPFFTTKPAGEGTGLGLCIVQRIVSQAGGKIRVKSKAGKGSTFFITLPINEGGRV